MKIIFFGKGKRGLKCLKSLLEAGESIISVVLQQGDPLVEQFKCIAEEHRIEIFFPKNPNSSEILIKFKSLKPDLFILAGYGLILKQQCLDIPKVISINLHGGKLPEYRGSSPMNWALINGAKNIGISIIEVDSGIDTGSILASSSLTIDENTNISDLHSWANEEFSNLLIDVVAKIKKGTLSPVRQDEAKSSYYPRRFAEDGFILWDQIDAIDAHNKIRALTLPYPCAFSFFKNRRINLISSRLTSNPVFGEAGRVYRKANGAFLISARDRALWITQAIFEDDSSPAYNELSLYDSLVTQKKEVLRNLQVST